MSKYLYKVYEVRENHNVWEPNLGVKYKGGVVAGIIGGIEDERLVVVGYEITEGEDGFKASREKGKRGAREIAALFRAQVCPPTRS